MYHATPYDLHAIGFYFSDYEEYITEAANHKNEFGDVVEEVEIQIIDAPNPELFSALHINQATLKTWFDYFEGMSGNDLIKALYIAEYLGCSTDAILDKLEEVDIFEGTAQEYADSYISDCGLLDQMPEQLRFYFDTESFARDLLLGGDITEIEIMGKCFIAIGG